MLPVGKARSVPPVGVDRVFRSHDLGEEIRETEGDRRHRVSGSCDPSAIQLTADRHHRRSEAPPADHRLVGTVSGGRGWVRVASYPRAAGG